ncbi:MAG: hypothetical protein IKU78_03400 [Paludibacteraceae bacterium]|nr:hypothetical protein [Paludibacteraceae bacterium]
MYSCSTTFQTVKTVTLKEPGKRYVGNEYKDMIGKTENYILQKMTAPDKESSDGNGGKILVYQDTKWITNSSSSSHTSTLGYGSTNTYVANTKITSYGNTSLYTDYNKKEKSVTEQNKKYINFFINDKGICYNVKTNIGDKYERTPGTYQDCTYTHKGIFMDHRWYWLWLLGPIPGIIVSIIDLVDFCTETTTKSCGKPYQK